MPLKGYCCPGAYCAIQFALVGCTSPFSSVARLISVDGCPSHFHGRRKRVRAFGNIGSFSAASVQLRPPSAETSTLATRPAPDQARPEISYSPGPFIVIPKDGLRMTDFAACANMNWRALPLG